MEYRIKYQAIVLILLLIPFVQSFGQKGTKKKIKVEIVDAKGEPISQAYIYTSESRDRYAVSYQGKATLDIKKDDELKIVAKGYKELIVSTQHFAGGKITLEPNVYKSGNDSKLYTIFGETTERRTVGAYSKVDGSALQANPTMYFMNALGGRLNGLYTMDNTMVPGFTSSTDFVRAPYGNFIILVDGVERSLSYIENEVVESVQLLKDASLKSLYGGAQANGILMIKTKRGALGENYSRFNVQTGIQTPTRLPKYLNSYQYTTKYNEAMMNSGLPPYYNPDNYTNGDPVRFPDVDYYGTFLNDNISITRANGQFSGGNESTQYFVHFGLQTNGGLEKFTAYPNSDEAFTLRGNIDNTVLGFIKVKAGFSAAMQSKKWPNMSTQTFFNMLSDNRPNEFPLTIPGSMLNSEKPGDVFGGTASNMNNPLGYLTARGYAGRDYSYVQTDLTTDIDLGKWVKGLRFTPSVTFDVYNDITSAQGATFVSYEPVVGNDNTLTFNSYGNDTKETSLSRTGTSVQRNYAVNFTGVYNNSFGKHDINALVTYYQQVKTFGAQYQYMNRLNMGGLVNYLYDNKYAVEMSLNRVGVGTFNTDNRFGYFPTIGVGWILSDEQFMQSTGIDYMKLRTSYGVLGYTSLDGNGIVSYDLYLDRWATGGTYGVNGFNNIAYLSQRGNPNLDYQKSKEFNVGFDLELLKKSLSLSVGYFNNQLSGVFATVEDIIPGVLGLNNGLAITQNYKAYLSSGFEWEANYVKKLKDWTVLVGANMTYGKSQITKEANPNYPEGFDGLRKVSTYGDILGLQYVGTFQNQAAIDAAPAQLFSNVLPGDIQYADLNNDNFVDNKDRIVVGNSLPTVQYGVNLSVAYKGVNLDVMGYGLAGFDRLLDNKYYQIYGNRKYSQVVYDGLPNGNPHPILRAESGTNNFQTSNYWIMDGSFFKIRNIELGYTLPKSLTKEVGLTNVKVYARGANLLTLSKIKDLDPESLDAGIGNFPLCRTITGGVSISF
jgi:TonB-linked SusC/RagA family outer membrane protein